MIHRLPENTKLLLCILGLRSSPSRRSRFLVLTKRIAASVTRMATSLSARHAQFHMKSHICGLQIRSFKGRLFLDQDNQILDSQDSEYEVPQNSVGVRMALTTMREVAWQRAHGDRNYGAINDETC